MYTDGHMHMSFNFGEEIPIIKGFTEISFVAIWVGSSTWFVIF